MPTLQPIFHLQQNGSANYLYLFGKIEIGSDCMGSIFMLLIVEVDWHYTNGFWGNTPMVRISTSKWFINVNFLTKN
ncbi:hypothetical protein MCAMS1_01642 [biofilm metagenome]